MTPQHFRRLGTCLKDVIFNQIQTHIVLIYRFTFFVLFFNTVVVHAQPVNLVPNGGFEERVECIYNDSNIEDAPPWFNPCVDEFIPATPDIFHGCAIVNNEPCPYPEEWYLDLWFAGVPTNFLGCEEPFDGQGYAGAFLFYPNAETDRDGYREYLAVKLTEPLEEDIEYTVSFQISLAERVTHAIWNVQVLLSNDSLVQPLDSYMDFLPQLSGTPGDFIANKTGWRELNWVYTAQGGELFLYIGNFQANSVVDTLDISGGMTFGHYLDASYYYFDNVLVKKNVLNTSSSSSKNSESIIYPNPCDTKITIKGNKVIINIEVFNALGMKLIDNSVPFANLTFLNVEMLDAGIYFLHTTASDNSIEVAKFVKR
jgi:hypothetical protein